MTYEIEFRTRNVKITSNHDNIEMIKNKINAIKGN